MKTLIPLALLLVPAAAWAAWQPSAAAPIHWQWQLTRFDLATDLVPHVTVYDLDATETPASTVAALHARGCTVIGYFSAGSYEDWRPDAHLFPSSVKGKSNGWPGERWLDIRQLSVLAPIMQARLDLAKEKGFDAVEPDNVDGFTNDTGFPLSGADQVRFNRWIAGQAHQRGLSVGLKNDTDQLSLLVPYFDWALNEEGFQFGDYEGYAAFTQANKAVFEVEYRAGTAQAGAMSRAHINSLSRDKDLVGPTQAPYRRLPCTPDTQDRW